MARLIDRSFLEETRLEIMLRSKGLVRNLGGESIFEGTTYTKPAFERNLLWQERVVWL